LASTVGVKNPYRYRGYRYDTETGLYYLQSRYYDPLVKRFINADGYVSTGQGVLGNNMFAYCLNNPATFVDPRGYSPDDSPFYEWGKKIGEWLKEKYEEYEDKKEERMNSVTYVPNASGYGAEIQDGNNIINPIEMYEFLAMHRGDEIGGTYTGIVFEWILHDVLYLLASLTNNEEGKKQAGKVNIGYTIFDDTEHGWKSELMHKLYTLLVPDFIHEYDKRKHESAKKE